MMTSYLKLWRHINSFIISKLKHIEFFKLYQRMFIPLLKVEVKSDMYWMKISLPDPHTSTVRCYDNHNFDMMNGIGMQIS